MESSHRKISKTISRSIGVLYKIRPFVNIKILKTLSNLSSSNLCYSGMGISGLYSHEPYNYTPKKNSKNDESVR